MKALFVNGSPRKNWSTAKMLGKAMEGAASAGAETELVHLYDDAFKGCISCFACKVKNSKTNCLCAFKDALTPILEKAHQADVLVIGTPIYFSYPTGPVRSFLERLMFPVLTYNQKVDEETGKVKASLLNKIVPTAMIYTMGAPEQMAKDLNYEHIFGENGRFLQMLFGYTESLCTYNTYQFSDYSRYDVMEDVEEMRAKQRDEVFPKDLEKAFELGKRLVIKAADCR